MASSKKHTDVTALRAEIAATQAEIEGIATAPLPLAEAEANLGDALDRLGALYQPDGILAEFARTPAPSMDLVGMLLGDARFDPVQVHAALAALHRDALLAGWLDRLRALYAADFELGRRAIPLAERPARVAALQQRLDELELAEERVVSEAERAGAVIDRRADARPEIIFHPSVIAADVPPGPLNAREPFETRDTR